jgi:integrase
LRDDVIILLMFRHGLRVSEIIALQWSQMDLTKGLLHVKRLKNGLPSTHPVRGTELRLLRQIKRKYSDSPYIFVSERKSPLTDRAIRGTVAKKPTSANLWL